MDTHAHIFERGLKLADARRYAPDYDATLVDCLHQLDLHGIARGVLVQPSFLGTDNGYLVEGLRQAGGRLRGVAVVEPTASVAELTRLGEAGVVGIRLNLIAKPLIDFTTEPWPTLLGRLRELNWQVEIQSEAHDLPSVVAPLLAAGLNVVVDHFSRPDPKLGIEDPGFRFLLSKAAAGTGLLWVKLSGAYRNGANGRGEAIARDAAPLLLGALGAERLVWGSDWPHTQFEKAVNYDSARAQFDTWITDPAQRKPFCEMHRTSCFGSENIRENHPAHCSHDMNKTTPYLQRRQGVLSLFAAVLVGSLLLVLHAMIWT